MKLTYQLTALCGTAYSNGNIEFGPEDTTIMSIVGTRISKFECSATSPSLITFPFESREEIETMHVSPNGKFLIAIEKNGKALFVNYVKGIVLSRINFKHPITVVRFSSDSRLFALGYSKFVQVWAVSDHSVDISELSSNTPLIQLVRIRCHSDEITSLTWSSCSRYLLTASADMTCKLLLIAPKGSKLNYYPYTLSGHKDPVVGAYFSSNHTKIFSVSQEGAIFEWGWVPKNSGSQKANIEMESLEYKIESNSDLELEMMQDTTFVDDNLFPSSANSTYRWMLLKRQFLNLTNRVIVTCSGFCLSRSLLVVGLSSGIFYIWDLSGESGIVLQVMSAFQDAISSITISMKGECIGLASKEKGQLTVWEWSSESFQLRQKGVPVQTNALAVSPDGSIIASGARGGGIVLWDALTNFSFMSLGGKDENASIDIKGKDLEGFESQSITAIGFCKRGKVLVAGSIDGTLKAFDLLRYRNFRTFSLPPASTGPISLLAVDPLGEIIAGVTETPVSSAVSAPFGIFLWNLTNGHLIDVLGGHQSTITAIVIDPISGKWIISGSLDKTARLWSLFASSSNTSATIANFTSEVLAIAARPDSTEVAISLLSGSIVFCETESLTQISSIDPQYIPRNACLTSTSNALSFTALAYSPDSALLFAGGRNSGTKIFVFGMEANHRPFLKELDIHPSSITSATKFHSGSNSLLISNHESTIVSIVASSDSIAVLSKGDGIFIFSLDQSLMFDPFDITEEVTPSNTLNTLNLAIEKKDISSAISSIMMSLKLNDPFLQHHLITSLGYCMGDSLSSVVDALSPSWALRLLCVLAEFSETKNEHIEILLHWISSLLSMHSTIIKKCAASRRVLPGISSSKLTGSKISTALRRIESVLVKNYSIVLKKAISNLDQLSILPTLEKFSSFSV